MICRFVTLLAALLLSSHAVWAVTFSKDVAPIVFENCASCHRPGEAGPFSLTNYAEVRKRARQIVEVTEDRFMPPWHAESAQVKFVGERRLSAREIEILREWEEAGAPEGDPEEVPPLPDFPEGWPLGEPDLIVEMAEVFEIPESGPDIYRNFMLPLNLTENKWVKAIEFRPGTPEVVHHSLFYFDTGGEARRLDAADRKPGFARMGRFERDGSLGGWAVGGRAVPLPEDLAYALPAGSDLILSTHFHPTGKPESERSKVGLYFAEEPPKRGFAGIQLPPHFGAISGVDIPAGESRYRKTDQFRLPVGVRAFGVSAHAHYLGKQMQMGAVLPDGSEIDLLSIPEWDFNWQEQYLYEDYVDLPAGTVVSAEVIWDNSAENPNNPSDPPRRVRWGRESTDEMGSVTLLVVTADRSAGALKALNTSYRNHVRDIGKNRIREVRENDGGFASIPKAILDKHRVRFDTDGNGKLEGDERAAALKAWQEYRARRRR